MRCPHCGSSVTTARAERTELGYRRFRCSGCTREFNERTGTLFNRLPYPTAVVRLVVLRRVRDKLSLRDLAEMFLERGFVFTHEAVREWEARLAPVLSETLRQQRRGKVEHIGILFEMERKHTHPPFDFAALRSGRTEVPPDSFIPVRAERRPQGGGEA